MHSCQVNPLQRSQYSSCNEVPLTTLATRITPALIRRFAMANDHVPEGIGSRHRYSSLEDIVDIVVWIVSSE